MGGLLPFLGGFTIVLIAMLASSAVLPLALAYVALRVRDARDADPDPELGAKTAYHLIHSLGVLMALAGLTVSAHDFLSGAIAPKQAAPQPQFGARPPGAAQKEEDGFNTAHRTALGLVVVGTLFAAAFWGFLVGTNDRTRRAAKRVFVGGRMALCLLVTMGTVAGLVVTLLQKDPNHEVTESLLAVLVVWLPAAAVHMFLFQAASREPRNRRPRDADDEAWTPRG